MKVMQITLKDHLSFRDELDENGCKFGAIAANSNKKSKTYGTSELSIYLSALLKVGVPLPDPIGDPLDGGHLPEARGHLLPGGPLPERTGICSLGVPSLSQ